MAPRRAGSSPPGRQWEESSPYLARRESASGSNTTVFPRPSSSVPRSSSSRKTRLTVALDVPASSAMFSCVNGMTACPEPSS